MKPETARLLKESGCANVGELFDRLVRVGSYLHQFKQENGRTMTPAELTYLGAVLGAISQEKQDEQRPMARQQLAVPPVPTEE
jgi:hypothetical protein